MEEKMGLKVEMDKEEERAKKTVADNIASFREEVRNGVREMGCARLAVIVAHSAGPRPSGPRH